MKVKELIAELQKMQGDKEVEIEQTGVGLSIFYEPIESIVETGDHVVIKQDDL